jgi:hypothetical protein
MDGRMSKIRITPQFCLKKDKKVFIAEFFQNGKIKYYDFLFPAQSKNDELDFSSLNDIECDEEYLPLSEVSFYFEKKK